MIARDPNIARLTFILSVFGKLLTFLCYVWGRRREKDDKKNCLSLYFILSTAAPLYAFEVYENETGFPLRANGIEIKEDAFEMIGIHEDYKPDDLVYIQVSVLLLAQNKVKGCHLPFRTYSHLKNEEVFFETTVLVLRRHDNLVCLPRAVEVSKDGSLKEDGSILTIPQAKRLIEPEYTLNRSATYVPSSNGLYGRRYAYPRVHKHIHPRGYPSQKRSYTPSPKKPEIILNAGDGLPLQTLQTRQARLTDGKTYNNFPLK